MYRFRRAECTHRCASTFFFKNIHRNKPPDKYCIVKISCHIRSSACITFYGTTDSTYTFPQRNRKIRNSNQERCKGDSENIFFYRLATFLYPDSFHFEILSEFLLPLFLFWQFPPFVTVTNLVWLMISKVYCYLCYIFHLVINQATHC